MIVLISFQIDLSFIPAILCIRIFFNSIVVINKPKKNTKIDLSIKKKCDQK